jgi:hypothetical protein
MLCSKFYLAPFVFCLPLCQLIFFFTHKGFLGDFHRFDVLSGVWTQLDGQGSTIIPGVRAGLGFTNLDGLLFAFGGHNESGQFWFDEEIEAMSASTLRVSGAGSESL